MLLPSVKLNVLISTFVDKQPNSIWLMSANLFLSTGFWGKTYQLGMVGFCGLTNVTLYSIYAKVRQVKSFSLMDLMRQWTSKKGANSSWITECTLFPGILLVSLPRIMRQKLKLCISSKVNYVWQKSNYVQIMR